MNPGEMCSKHLFFLPNSMFSSSQLLKLLKDQLSFNHVSIELLSTAGFSTVEQEEKMKRRNQKIPQLTNNEVKEQD